MPLYIDAGLVNKSPKVGTPTEGKESGVNVAINQWKRSRNCHDPIVQFALLLTKNQKFITAI